MFVLFNFKILYSFPFPHHGLARNFAMASHNLLTHIYKLKKEHYNTLTQKLNNERTNTMKSYQAPLTAQAINESNDKIPSPFCFFFICEFIIRSDPVL